MLENEKIEDFWLLFFAINLIKFEIYEIGKTRKKIDLIDVDALRKKI